MVEIFTADSLKELKTTINAWIVANSPTQVFTVVWNFSGSGYEAVMTYVP